MFRSRLSLLLLLLSCFTARPAAAPREPWKGNRFQGSPYPPAPYVTERLFAHASFREATDFAFAPGTSQLFVSQQDGKIFAFDTRKVSDPLQLVVDIHQLSHRRSDNILGFTFDPGFATNRFIYLNCNGPENQKDASHIVRYRIPSMTAPAIEAATEHIILRWPSGGHNGCTLAFGPDGMLYISTGDGAAPDPPDGRFKTGQDLSDLLGSVLRIDVRTSTPDRPYTIPSDNPFIGLAGARPENWAFGFRNPFRMSFAPDGALWVTDVGWEQWEMVYRIVRGGNYGWPITEGPNLRVRSDIQPGPGPIRPPIHSIPHTDGASISGGMFSRSTRLPGLRDAYVYGDWETGRFWALRHSGEQLLSNVELCDTALKPVSFANDADGDVLILDFNTGIYRLAANSAPAANQAFPHRLGDSGLFESVAHMKPAPGVVPYRIRAPMWNDHALADWWLGVPFDQAVATRGGLGNITGGTWYFPTNTVLAKTLTLRFREGDPSSARRIETQILHWDGQGWNPYSYRWNTEQTDAELVDASGAQTVFVVDDASAPGGKRHTPWRFQSRGECLRCHNAWAGETLTLQTLQLGSPSAPETSDPSEFDRLVRLGVLRASGNEDRRRGGPALVDPSSAAHSLEDRARSWLHSNCSACHRFGAGGAADLRLNRELSTAELRVADVRPTRGDYDLREARIVAPGDPWRSTLLFRIATEGSGRMPHIGSRLADPTGVALIRDWIRSLPHPDSSRATLADAMNARRSEIERILASPQPDAASTTALLTDMNGAIAAVVGTNAARRIAALQNAAPSHPHVMVRDFLQRVLPADQRRITLGTDFPASEVLSLVGDANRGREVFRGTGQCVRCHTLENVGRTFGPDLAGIARRYPRAQILDHILKPSAAIAPEFRSVSVTLRDDTEYVGFILRRDADSLVLRDETLTDRTLRSAEIRESRESGLSAMPEGLLAPLTAQEGADLLEYLLSR